jgi:hypothetical protein
VLLADIRGAVISRMYTMQPRRGNEAVVERSEAPAAAGAGAAALPAAPEEPVEENRNDRENTSENSITPGDPQKKKRRRH